MEDHLMGRSDDDLRALLADLELDLVERKEFAADTDKIAQVICAYANDLPGYETSGVVFVGATDDGHPSGLAITDKLLLSLANLRDTGKILPLPSMWVSRLDVDGQHVAVIEVQPSPSPPVRYEGRVWIRVGPRRASASADEDRRLSERRRAADLTFSDRRAGRGRRSSGASHHCCAGDDRLALAPGDLACPGSRMSCRASGRTASTARNVPSGSSRHSVA
jgi:ATP-dependent DNA helicase RecG